MVGAYRENCDVPGEFWTVLSASVHHIFSSLQGVFASRNRRVGRVSIPEGGVLRGSGSSVRRDWFGRGLRALYEEDGRPAGSRLPGACPRGVGRSLCRERGGRRAGLFSGTSFMLKRPSKRCAEPGRVIPSEIELLAPKFGA
jgi:hypothetical protein